MLFAAGLQSCTSYAPKPIGSAQIEQFASERSLDRLGVKVSELRRPSLPVDAVVHPDGSMNSAGAASLAIVANPSLRAARARAGVARAQLLQAGLLPNPVLSADIGFPSFGSTQDTTSNYNVGLNWEVTALLTREAAINAASAQVRAIDMEIAWLEWQTAMAARLSATRLVWLSRRLDAAKETEIDSRYFETRVADALAKGWLTSSDSQAASAAAEKAAQARLLIETQIAAEQLALKRAIGLEPATPVRIIDVAAETAAHPIDPRPLAAELDSRRLDLIALRCGYESQEEKLRAAIRSQFPKMSIGFLAGRDNTDVGIVGLGVSIDLPLFDRGQGRIALETATREQLFEEFFARRFEAVSDISKTASDHNAALVQTRQAAEVVARLKALSTSLETALMQHQADAVQVFQVRQQLADARQALLAFYQQCAELKVASEAVSGRLLPEN